ncbi:MAG: sigma 54-interacting transcriptional regulator [Desulfobacterales bacterium]
MKKQTGGTIFLDEIGDINPFIQLKLLRAIQEKQIERVGDSQKRFVDIRIITATHKDLYRLVEQGRFREDLYYRLKVFPIHIPPLRNRKEDIPLLTRHFITQFNQKTGKSIKDLTSDALRVFMDYHWPGNVRGTRKMPQSMPLSCAPISTSVFLTCPLKSDKWTSDQWTRHGPPADGRPAHRLSA